MTRRPSIPSEMEATMDNLEMLLEAVGVARQKRLRDRRRRSVPKRAPRRPEADPVRTRSTMPKRARKKSWRLSRSRRRSTKPTVELE